MVNSSRSESTDISVGIKSKVEPVGEREYSVWESATSCIENVEVLKDKKPSARPRVPFCPVTVGTSATSAANKAA